MNTEQWKKGIGSWTGMVMALGIGTSAALQAGDWPQFRGPQANSVASESDWVSALGEETLDWRAALPGRGLSSPIVVGDRVFVTCASGAKKDRLHVICLNATDGSKRWERQFWATGRTMTHDKTSVAAPTPVSDGRRVYALFSSNDLICLDMDGNLVWLRGLTRDYPNASNSLGLASSPVVAGDTLVVQVENDSESFAAGIDTTTGVNRWKSDRPKAANWTSPLLIQDPGSSRTLVALQSSRGIHAVDPRTGQVVWEYTDGAATMASSASDARGVLYVPSHGITALKFSGGSSEPESLWRAGQLNPATASPVAVGQRVYVLNNAGILSCGDAATGERLWQLRLKGPFSATPVAVGHHLYCVNEKGVAQVVDISAAEGAVVNEHELGDVVLSTPSAAGQAIYFRSDAHVWRFKGKPSSQAPPL
jgi:outer membrane protein assembly factor BamB